ncbi:ribonuclease P protein subunit p29 isoform X2 [Chaetodon auriga]|uniref:ribonuclease P protein subunit p29 isoform X2 n=1 Tax=Chaetodon auriga TaxID=39042 RepID=UPI004033012B
MDEALVRATIPHDLVKVLGVKINSKVEAFTQAFLKNSLQHHTRHDLKTVLSYKAVILGYTRPKKDKLKRNRKKAKGLSAQQKRTMKIFQIKPEHQRYKLFLPLHELWRQYITDLCSGLKPTSSPQFVQQKLLKADFHGAIITDSKCLTLPEKIIIRCLSRINAHKSTWKTENLPENHHVLKFSTVS